MNNLTIHTLTALPLHNLNRDESGAPKQVFEGGVTRARLSSQSIKRAARIGFERTLAETDRSVRSKAHVDDLVQQAVGAAGRDVTDAERKKLERAIRGIVNKLTQASKGDDAKDDDGKKDTLVWLSAGERATLVRNAVSQVLTGGADSIDGIAVGKSTDSLAIAAFGRMFAAAPSLTMEAAVSVGNATTTHEAAIEVDYFTAVDDLTAAAGESGAGQLGYQMYTSGVYYQAITIDRAQLLRNFDGDLDDPRIVSELNELVRQLVVALPQGKKSGTAPFAHPSVVLLEEQAYRTAYQFQTPVQPDEDGGYVTTSAAALAEKAVKARKFDPAAFGASFLTGTDPELVTGLDATVGTLSDATAFVVEWIRAGR